MSNSDKHSGDSESGLEALHLTLTLMRKEVSVSEVPPLSDNITEYEFVLSSNYGHCQFGHKTSLVTRCYVWTDDQKHMK